MAPLAREEYRRRQEDSISASFTSNPAAESSIPEGADSSPSPSSTPLKLPVPAIAGIVTVGLISVGLGVLLWRWKVRMREVRRLSRTLHGSMQKYGVGRGISSEDSTQKLEIPGSFFEADDFQDRRRRKSSLTFTVASMTPQTTTKPPRRRSQSQPRASSISKKVSSSFSGSYSVKVDERRPIKVQHYPDSVRTKGISAPLHIANGSPEPWSPVTPSTSSMASRQPPRPPKVTSPPPVAFPPSMKEVRPSHLRNDLHPGWNTDSSKRTISLFSSDGSLYSRNSLSSDNIGSPTSPSTMPSHIKNTTHSRQPSTPPLPPSTVTLAHMGLYNYDSDPGRSPGGAGSQHSPNLPRLMTVITRFVPTLDDELLLQVGDSVRVIEEYRDGWCLVQQVGRIDSPRGVVPAVCLQERRRVVPVPLSVAGSLSMKRSDGSLASQRR